MPIFDIIDVRGSVVCHYEDHIHNAIIELLTFLHMDTNGYLNNIVLDPTGEDVYNGHTITTFAMFVHETFILNMAADDHYLLFYV